MTRRAPRGSLLDRAIGARHGLVQKPQFISTAPADLDAIHNCSVAYDRGDRWRTAGGGVGWDTETARNAALGEALERYAAVSYSLPTTQADGPRRGDERLDLSEFSLFSDEQIQDPAFPHASTFSALTTFTDAYSLSDNRQVWVPAALVGLTDSFGALPTSSGLAAAPTVELALLRATQEIIERDALMTTWLHGVAPKRVILPQALVEPVEDRGGWVVVLDITPEFSPHKVALVAGNLPIEGRPRYSIGAACRSRWEDAADKAYLEWTQGVIFAGHRAKREAGLSFQSADDVRTFDDHAVYYTVHPDRWDELPLLRNPQEPISIGSPDPAKSTAEALALLVEHLNHSGVRLFYRDLTLGDLKQIGLRVCRVLSPDLTPIHADHCWPHLGGRSSDLLWRYPWAADQPIIFPSPHPHPLG